MTREQLAKELAEKAVKHLIHQVLPDNVKELAKEDDVVEKLIQLHLDTMDYDDLKILVGTCKAKYINKIEKIRKDTLKLLIRKKKEQA